MIDMSVDVYPVVHRLGLLFERIRELELEHPVTGGSGPALLYKDITAAPLKTRLEGVDNALRGLRYAVWCIGETLCTFGGTDLMHKVFNAFEAEHGIRGASWLDHRWDGIHVNDAMWCA